MKSFSTSADEEVTTYVTGRLFWDLIFPNYIQIIILCKWEIKSSNTLKKLQNSLKMWPSQYTCSPPLHHFTYQANSMRSVNHRVGPNISHFSAGLQGLFLLILLPSDKREGLSLSFPVLPLMAKSMGRQGERQTPPLLVLFIMGVLEMERCRTCVYM